jgi:glycine cleavage system H protein
METWPFTARTEQRPVFIPDLVPRSFPLAGRYNTVRHARGMSDVPELYYRRSLFRTRLLGDRLYTASHFWLQEHEPGVWHVGLTKFASRMLGDIVEIAFEVEVGATVQVGDSIGWFEGFKARSDLYSVAAGIFGGANPELADRLALIEDDRYRRGWLYAVRGTPEPSAMDLHGYAALLDTTIDRMRQSRAEQSE